MNAHEDNARRAQQFRDSTYLTDRDDGPAEPKGKVTRTGVFPWQPRPDRWVWTCARCQAVSPSYAGKHEAEHSLRDHDGLFHRSSTSLRRDRNLWRNNG